jgi:tRNA threonylcarbamoyladenosine biosynthesis protein TsaE
MFENGIHLTSLGETEEFGRLLGRAASPGDIICLDGDLGAGKTTLTQAIAKGLDVPETCYVTSPSFSILHEYPGRIPLYHMDFYRLSRAVEIEEQGLEEYFYMSGLTVVEWSLNAAAILPAERLSLFLSITAGDERLIRCTHIAGSWLEKTSIFWDCMVNKHH